jgi:kynurenine formamidase
MEWRKVIIDSYGSVAKFHDASTVESVREMIAKRIKDANVILDAANEHPGLILSDDAAKIKVEIAEITALDAELVQWQQARKFEREGVVFSEDALIALVKRNIKAWATEEFEANEHSPVSLEQRIAENTETFLASLGEELNKETV